MTDIKTRKYFINVILDKQERFSIKIPDSEVDSLYDADTIEFNIDVEEVDRHSILIKNDKWKLKK